ncbi:MAG: M20 family metallo-hydrolase [Bacteroidota bacterium]|nr:M20 family metallo-hydrolase [Bacteroidota bacterium]
MSLQPLTDDAILLLKNLISTKSFSKEEDETATIIEIFFRSKDIPTNRLKNNVWSKNKFYDPQKPTILLNSHHDTVKPNPGYTNNPYDAFEEDGRLYGLGSNDAGGCLVSLIATFCHFYPKENLKYNFILAATAEEEISGNDGLELLLPDLGELEFAIVGEPTQMDLAIAEKGLLVLDCIATGRAGHAAREEGDNAIYKAIKDINWFQNYKFEKVSPFLGPIKMSVTLINAGSAHNVVPHICEFVVDVRVTEMYAPEEILKTIQNHIKSVVKPRSVRLKPSSIDPGHPIVQAGLRLGGKTYGSPTTSDQALLSIPSLKMGPGHSERSHTANEYVYLHEIKEGIEKYVAILEEIL